MAKHGRSQARAIAAAHCVTLTPLPACRPNPRLCPSREADPEEEMQHAFRLFDRDRDGKITPKEMTQALAGFGVHLTEREVDQVRLAQAPTRAPLPKMRHEQHPLAACMCYMSGWHVKPRVRWASVHLRDMQVRTWSRLNVSLRRALTDFVFCLRLWHGVGRCLVCAVDCRGDALKRASGVV